MVANKVLVILAKGLEMYENLWVVMCWDKGDMPSWISRDICIENIESLLALYLTITTHEDNVLDSKYNYQPQHFKFSKNIPDSTADNVFLNSYLLDFKQNFTALH